MPTRLLRYRFGDQERHLVPTVAIIPPVELPDKGEGADACEIGRESVVIGVNPCLGGGVARAS
ncbi:MAG: hypothetical protein ABFE13_16295 [Phycisphaerales bacterium]